MVLGIAFDWDNISEEIENIIFIKDRTQYLVVDKQGTIVIDVKDNDISRLKDQANRIIDKMNIEKNGIKVMSPDTVAGQYEHGENHEITSLKNIFVDGNSLESWKSVVIRSDK